jgi:Ca-activated chloride channel homolog
MNRNVVFMAAAAALLGAMALTAPRANAIGLLIPNDRSLAPLAVRSHRVNIDITDQAAVTRVEQVFHNSTSRQLEATFIFPVPPGATVSDFSLWINGKKTKGAVLEKDEARRIYEGIVRRTEDPGLIEYMDGTLFQARIFPVPARGDQKVEIAFAQVLDKTGSVRRLLYPLKTGRAAARTMEDFTMVVNVDSRAELKTIYSPSHKVAISRKSDHKAVVSMEESSADLERDFLLYLSTGGEDIGISLLTYDEDGRGGEDGYYLMTLTPRIEVDEDDIPAKAVTFVVDTSGSMSGEKMEQAREALKQCLAGLNEKDSFNVIRFSTDVEKLFPRLTKVTRESRDRGLRFAADLEAAGGTAIDDALSQALSAKAPSGTPHMVIFLTDGRPTVGSTDIGQIVSNVKKRAGNARVFAFGVGFQVNTTLLDTIARDTHASADYVRPNEDIEVKVSGLYNKIAYPALTDVSVDYGDARVYDAYPRQVPDLFRGGQIVLMGRYRNEIPSDIDVQGNIAGDRIGLEFREEGDDDEDDDQATKAHDFIPKLWATRKVGFLLEEIRNGGERGELKTEVIRLGKKYGLVTPYTSYLAVDDSELEGNRGRPIVNQPDPRDDQLFGGRPSADEAAEDDAPNFAWGGGGSGGASPSPKAAQGPRRSVAKKAKADQWRRERVLREKGAFDKDSGRDAVEASIATEDLKSAEYGDGASGLKTRYSADRLFVFKSGAWRQDGTEGVKPHVRVKYLSAAYFNLVKARPELRQALSMGGRVVLKVGKKVVEIGAAGQEDLSVSTIKGW